MSKILKGVSKIAGVIATVTAFIPGLQPIAAIAGTVAAVTAIGSSLLAKKPKAPDTSATASDRLNANIVTNTPRKSALGYTALNTDIRDQELTDDDSQLHRFLVVASHKVGSIDQIWLDDKLAWSATGGISADFLGYLGVECYTEGSAANAKNISPRMGSTRRYTGLAWVYLRFKLTGNTKKSESPFAQSVPTRITIIGGGAYLYDPRLDSTVPGGSGSCRADDQSTWVYNSSVRSNTALHLLWYLLGWKINGKLAVGKGIPPARIDLPSFITAANLCDEPVTKAAGGTEPRYRTDGVWSEGDPTQTVIDQLKASMNATLDDMDGKLRVTVLHNDLATPVVDLTEDDILGDVDWDQTAALDETFNIVRGTYIDPSTNSLYQAVDYPEVRIDSPDDIDRTETVDLQFVQSPSQAQRLAKQRLARMLYSGTFTASYSHRAWKAQKGSVIRQSFAPLGFTNKLFRVIDTDVRVDGTCNMVLREENASIYLWDAEEAPAVQPAEPTRYDPYLGPIYQDVSDPKYADGESINNLRPAEPGATNGATPEQAEQIEDNATLIAALQTAVLAAQDQIDEIEGSVTVDIADLVARITAAEGDVVYLETVTASQGSSISTNATAISNVVGNLATLTTRVNAGAPNLLPLGGFANGLTGWSVSGPQWGAPPPNDPNWGAYVYVAGAGGNYYAGSPVQSAQPNASYSIRCDIDFGGSTAGYVAARIVWTVGGALHSVGPAAVGTGGFSDDESARPWATGICPADANGFYVQLVAEGVSSNKYFRLCKVNRGSVPARWSEEAAVAQTFRAVQTADTQIAQLSSDLSTANANIATNALAITDLSGSQASMAATLSTQGANIASLLTVTSTLLGDTATMKLQLTAGGGNALTNTDLAIGTEGWTSAGSTGAISFARDLAGSAWHPPGEHVLGIYQNDTDAGAYGDWVTAQASVQAGEWWEGSFWVASHRCETQLYIGWVNTAGGIIGYSGPATTGSGGFTRRSGGTTLGDFTRIWVKDQAPAGAVRAFIILRKLGTIPAEAGADPSSYAWFLRSQLKRTLADTASPLAYSVGGAGASFLQQAQALSTLDSNFAALSSTVATTNSNVTVIQAALDNVEGRTAVFWQVTAVSGGRAQLTVFADANGGGGVDIGGDVSIHGNLMVAGSITTETIAPNAVINMASAVYPGAISITAGDGWVDASSVVISTIGEDVDVVAQFDSYRSSGPSSNTIRAQVVRINTSTLAETVIEQRNGANTVSAPPASFFTVDSPPAGSWRYLLRFEVEGTSGNHLVSGQGVKAVEFKR
ncbi:phage tail protein [Sphingobium sp. H39-3-25]|uniref:phage tail protein n=1 Tax=Sphingobium arseniciresistens TaxID=3030834 RepID=UPI0023B8AF0E|nr:phage tail protein [Sphingobium arseniciresistens]